MVGGIGRSEKPVLFHVDTSLPHEDQKLMKDINQALEAHTEKVLANPDIPQFHNKRLRLRINQAAILRRIADRLLL